MRSRIAKGPERSLHQGQQAGVLHALAVSLKAVKSEHRVSAFTYAERCIDQTCAVVCQTRLFPDFFGEALGRFEDGVEVVFLNQFSAAELQHIGVNAAAA